jgi:hypothetical protein
MSVGSRLVSRGTGHTQCSCLPVRIWLPSAGIGLGGTAEPFGAMTTVGGAQKRCVVKNMVCNLNQMLHSRGKSGDGVCQLWPV